MARFRIDGEWHEVGSADAVYAGAQCDGCGQADGLDVSDNGRTLTCPDCGATYEAR